MRPAKVQMVSIYIPENGNVGFLTCIRDNTLFIQETFSNSKFSGRIKEGDTILALNRCVVGDQITCQEAVKQLQEAEYRVDIVLATEPDPDKFTAPLPNNPSSNLAVDENECLEEQVDVQTPLRSDSWLPFVQHSPSLSTPQMPDLTPNHSTSNSNTVNSPPQLSNEGHLSSSGIVPLSHRGCENLQDELNIATIPISSPSKIEKNPLSTPEADELEQEMGSPPKRLRIISSGSSSNGDASTQPPAPSNNSYSLTPPRRKEDRHFWSEYLGNTK